MEEGGGMGPHPETHPIKERQRAVVLEAPPKPGLLSLTGVGQGPRAQSSNSPGVGGQVSLCNRAREAESSGPLSHKETDQFFKQHKHSTSSLELDNHRSLAFQSQKVCRDHPVLLVLLKQSLLAV